MIYCKKCAMPDTRPGSVFDDEGICGACRNYEKRSTIDWDKRREELRELCDKYRRDDGYYDCVIPVSGGKDSHFLVYMMKEKMGMNPLLITVGDPFTKTQAGQKNYRNLGETFNCDHMLFELSIDLFRKVTKFGTEEVGEPLRFVEIALYTVPTKLAIQLGIPLIVYGENGSYEYGSTDVDTGYGLETFQKVFSRINMDFWLERGISKKELNGVIPPTQAELDNLNPKLIYMSYFAPWNSTTNLEVAKRYGFGDLAHEWKREGYIEDFEQIDSEGYLVHLWMKYPKFGFQRTSDIASRRVREGKLGLQEAKRLIMENDHKLDQRSMQDFIDFLGYSRKQFWDIVEKFWNREIFEKVDGIWRLKNPVYKDLIEGEESVRSCDIPTPALAR